MAALRHEATLSPWNVASANSNTRPGVREGAPDTCPFWTDDGCAVSRYWADFGSNQKLAELLLDLRERLGGRDQRSAFRRFHPPGLA